MWFKKKKNENDEQLKEILIKYIYESRRDGISDEEIVIKLDAKGYSKDIIEECFKITNNFKQLNKKREVKMAEEYDEEEFEEEDSEDIEDEDNLEEDEQELKPKKTETKKPRKEIKDVKTNQKLVDDSDNQLNQILSNHEQRLQSIESALFRLKGSI
jgi:hypothetical protein